MVVKGWSLVRASVVVGEGCLLVARTRVALEKAALWVDRTVREEGDARDRSRAREAPVRSIFLSIGVAGLLSGRGPVTVLDCVRRMS